MPTTFGPRASDQIARQVRKVERQASELYYRINRYVDLRVPPAAFWFARANGAIPAATDETTPGKGEAFVQTETTSGASSTNPTLSDGSEYDVYNLGGEIPDGAIFAMVTTPDGFSYALPDQSVKVAKSTTIITRRNNATPGSGDAETYQVDDTSDYVATGATVTIDNPFDAEIPSGTWLLWEIDGANRPTLIAADCPPPGGAQKSYSGYQPGDTIDDTTDNAIILSGGTGSTVTLPTTAANDGESQIVSNRTGADLTVATQGGNLLYGKYWEGTTSFILDAGEIATLQALDQLTVPGWYLMSEHPLDQLSQATANAGVDWSVPSSTYTVVPGWDNIAITGSDGMYRQLFDFVFEYTAVPGGNASVGVQLELQVSDGGGGWITIGEFEQIQSNKEVVVGDQISANLVTPAFAAVTGDTFRLRARLWDGSEGIDLIAPAIVETMRISDTQPIVVS